MAPISNDRRVAYEKLLIGPITVVGEMLTGGHWMEMLKIQRQAATYESYAAAAKHMWQQLGIAGFYKGFWPWGFVQGCYKGLPVLFTQGEVKHRLVDAGINPKTAGVLAGCTAGVIQGAMIAPTQRLKSMVRTNPNAGAVSTHLITETIKREGVITVFRGIEVMMLRRGVDWGIRFYGVGLAERFFVSRKPQGEKKLSTVEAFAAGLFGGAFSALDHPLDVWVANCQKHREGASRPAGQVLKELMAESSQKGLLKVWFRGVEMRLVHSAYHTAWMAGLGQVIFSKYRDWVGLPPEKGSIH
eukprot:NODE_4395_length_1174_cov_6.364415_g3883_i0.p1 GENE.NODE_4395_length_1174_cov_6.364415_g3883_i0~~NODE_4395_length_1174_cov_6.364415_g3883_i0.p1  ORF type:complete len:300 (+),score=48.63 NODE_4395_length_1174_cov_6.364415_g3883_i0:61-960(+)